MSTLLFFYLYDEFVEITPEYIRLRKQILNTEQRKKVDAKNK